MTEELLRCKTEREIRARFCFAPGYYLQAKLEKRRALGRLDRQATADTEASGQAVQAEQPIERATLPEPASLDVTALAPEPTKATTPAPESPEVTVLVPESPEVTVLAHDSPEVTVLAPESTEDAILEFENLNVAAPDRVRPNATPPGREIPDFALPGFEILEAALFESDGPDTMPVEPVSPDPGLTQQAILEDALEDYSNWPLLSDSESEQESQAGSELERKLALVLESVPELEVVLDSESELERELEAEPRVGLASNNVTLADFGHRAPRTIRVVSVVMDRKRPNMVRVASESTRLAS